MGCAHCLRRGRTISRAPRLGRSCGSFLGRLAPLALCSPLPRLRGSFPSVEVGGQTLHPTAQNGHFVPLLRKGSGLAPLTKWTFCSIAARLPLPSALGWLCFLGGGLPPPKKHTEKKREKRKKMIFSVEKKQKFFFKENVEFLRILSFLVPYVGQLSTGKTLYIVFYFFTIPLLNFMKKYVKVKDMLFRNSSLTLPHFFKFFSLSGICAKREFDGVLTFT